jgi:hypothetical protein
MKRSIIHNGHLPWFQRCNEELFHPGIEDFSIGSAIVNTFGNDLAIDTSDNVPPLKFLPSHKANHLFLLLLIWHFSYADADRPHFHPHRLCLPFCRGRLPSHTPHVSPHPALYIVISL